MAIHELGAALCLREIASLRSQRRGGGAGGVVARKHTTVFAKSAHPYVFARSVATWQSKVLC